MITNKLPKQLKSINEIYKNLSTKIVETVPNSIINILHLDIVSNTLTVRELNGMRNKLVNILLKLCNQHPLYKTYNNTLLGTELYMTDCAVRIHKPDLHSLTEGQIPKRISDLVIKLFKIKQINTIGLNCNGNPFGGVVILSSEQLSEEQIHRLQLLAIDFSVQLNELVTHNKLILKLPKTKDVFADILINNVSHELRTHLHGIIGLLNITNEMHAQSKSNIDEILNNANGLLDTVDKMIKISEFESNLAHHRFLHTSANELRIIVNNIVNTLCKEYQYARINFRFEELREGKILCLDHDYFTFAVKELLNNALKFSDSPVDLHILVDESLIMSVTDYGIGISSEDKPKLFKKYSKIENPHKTYKGLGLGLVLVKYIVREHKGDVYLSSNLDKGSKFILTLPVHAKSSGRMVKRKETKKTKLLAEC